MYFAREKIIWQFWRYLRATLSPSLWQVYSMALSTMSRVMFSPAWSLSFRHWRDAARKLARQARAAGTFSLNTKRQLVRGSSSTVTPKQ